FETLAHPEDVPVRMPHVHLAHFPRLVGRRKGHLDSLGQAMLIEGVDVIDPDRHPDAVLAALAALIALAEEDLAPAGADAAEGRRIAPVPTLLPAELFEPGEALLDVGDVQDRRDALGVHGVHPMSFSISSCAARV